MAEHYDLIKKDDGTEVFKCLYCDFEADTQGKMLAHHNPYSKSRCEKRDFTPLLEELERKKEEKKKIMEAGEKALRGEFVEEGAVSQPEPKPKTEGESLYKRRRTPNEILYDVISKHPDLSEKHITEVMGWAEDKGELDPMTLEHILSNLSGISKQTANLIAQRYTRKLHKEAQEPDADIRIASLLGMPVQHPQQPPFLYPYSLHSLRPPQHQFTQPQYPVTHSQQLQPYPHLYPPYSPFYPPYPQYYWSRAEEKRFEEIKKKDEEIEVLKKQIEEFKTMLTTQQQQHTEELRRLHEKREKDALIEEIRQLRIESRAREDELKAALDQQREREREIRLQEHENRLASMLERNTSILESRIAAIEHRPPPTVIPSGADPEVTLALKKMDAQTGILIKGMENLHSTVSEGIRAWKEMNMPKLPPHVEVAKQQFSDDELREMEKELKQERKKKR